MLYLYSFYHCVATLVDGLKPRQWLIEVRGRYIGSYLTRCLFTLPAYGSRLFRLKLVFLS